MIRWQPESVWIESSESDSAVATLVRQRLPQAPVHIVEDIRLAETSRFHEGKRRLVVQRHRGSFLQHCPAGTPGLVCCNYLVMSFASNCPFDCSYCFLQDYLANNPAIKVFSNPGDALTEVDKVLRTHPARNFRIGTGELADSLALDHLTDLTHVLVPFFAAHKNATLELKTKSDNIGNLLQLDPGNQVVVAWSVNAREIMAEEEPGAATLPERLAAARRIQAAGYRIGFHFDPLVAIEGWEEGYRDTIAQIAAGVDLHRVAWISLGSLRLSPGLKNRIRERPGGSRVLHTELVPSGDGKERVWRGVRVKMYRRLIQWIRALEVEVPLYICMEPANVWEKTFGEVPSDRLVAQRILNLTP